MSESLLPQRDCSTGHQWNLVLRTSGRRVALQCLRCGTTDKDEWGPGGVADLVTWQFDLFDPANMDVPAHLKIQVNGGNHTSPYDQVIPVNLTVTQSTRITGYRSGGPVGLSADTKVQLSLRAPVI